MKRPKEEISWDIIPFICLFNIFSLVSLDTFHIPVSMSRPLPYDSLQPESTHREDFIFWPWKGTHYQNCPPSVIIRKQHEILATDHFRQGIMGGTGRGAQSQAILLKWGDKTGDRRPWQLEFAGHSPWEKETTQRKFQKSAYISLQGATQVPSVREEKLPRVQKVLLPESSLACSSWGRWWRGINNKAPVSQEPPQLQKAIGWGKERKGVKARHALQRAKEELF